MIQKISGYFEDAEYPMSNLSDHFGSLDNTMSGDATAAQIEAPAKAWVDGEELTGTATLGSDMSNADLLLYWTFGRGASGAYVPDIDDAEYVAAGVSIVDNAATWTRDGNGWITATNNSALRFTLPAKTTACRRFIYNVRCPAYGVAGNEIRFLHNYETATDYWCWRLIDNGGYFRGMIVEFTSSVWSERHNIAFGTLMDAPAAFSLVLDDWGDSLVGSMFGSEYPAPASTNDLYGIALKYRQASRTHKTYPSHGIINYTDTEIFEIHSIQIMDLPDV
jgi:hypothetical protein